jgi:hypothetical protein
MLYSKRVKRAAAIVAITAGGMISTAAVASAGSGLTSEVLVTADLTYDALINHDRVKFQTKDPTAVRIQKLTFAAGAYSGWHHHPGVIIVSVQSGLVTLYDSTCGSVTYGPGSANGSVFVEGHDSPQEARSAAGAVTFVTYVVPVSNPLATRFRIEDQVPFCATSF